MADGTDHARIKGLDFILRQAQDGRVRKAELDFRK